MLARHRNRLFYHLLLDGEQHAAIES